MPFDDLLLDPAPTIGDAARRDWRWYAPAWAVPLVSLVVGAADKTGTMPAAVPDAAVFPVLAVLFFAAQLVAFVPRVIGRATNRQYYVLAGLMPLAIFVGLVLTVQPFVLVFLDRAPRR